MFDWWWFLLPGPLLLVVAVRQWWRRQVRAYDAAERDAAAQDARAAWRAEYVAALRQRAALAALDRIGQ